MFNKDQLRQLVDDSGRSLASIDRDAGNKPGLMSQYVCGTRIPKPDTLYQYLFALGFTEEQLKEQRIVDWYPVE